MRNPQLRLRLTAKRAIEKQPRAEDRPDLVRRVLQFVSVDLGIGVGRLMKARFPPSLVRGRRLVFYICRHELKMSYPAIARAFKRDHSNVVHSLRGFEPTGDEKAVIALCREPQPREPVEYPDALIEQLGAMRKRLEDLAREMDHLQGEVIRHELRRTYGAQVVEAAAETAKCKGCGCEIAPSETWCSECLCEEDGCD